MGAEATVTLSPAAGAKTVAGNAMFKLTDVNGRSFTTRLAAPPAGAEATQ
jgi:hypothetical protein